ncbi:MAG TPA: hypothetical protein VK391_01365 [Allosphingosinicella sp.]|jgi:hypothetical protein|nr:hypothetical protein [Allosphingosinicella sp.]
MARAVSRGVAGIASTALVAIAVLTPVHPEAHAMSRQPEGAPQAAAPARPGDVAIREELDAARAAGTRAAYEFFIARHPGHALEAVARAEMERLPPDSRR